jgi:hypothetical protein
MCGKSALISGLILALVLASSLSAGLIGYWKLDEGAGTTARDSSGKNNNGTLRGGPLWVAGKVGQALSFDGVDDYVEVPHNASLIPTSGKATVSVWINAKRYTGPGGSQWQGILAKGGWDPRLYNMYTEASGVIHFSTGPGNATIGSLSPAHLPLNEWVHVTVAVDGKHIYYFNGEPVGEAGQGATVPNAGTAVFTIGQTGESNFFLGMIDDVQLYDRALTAEQIKGVFNGVMPVFGKAEKPSPANGATGVLLGLLTWTPGDVAVFEDVYLGTTPDLTAADRVSTHQSTMLKMYFHLPGLVSGQKYYWRVDDFDAAGNVYPGDVWSFTATPIKAYAPSPSDGAKYVMPDTKLAWSPGSTAIAHEVYLGTSQDDVAAGAAGVVKGKTSALTFDPCGLANDTVYYWRIDEVDAKGVKQTGYVWSFRTLPLIPVSDPNLVGWWKLDEPSGPVVVDWSGHNNHGALQGAPQRVPGYDGGALKLNGASDYVEVPHSDVLTVDGEVTVMAWINAGRHNGPTSDWQAIVAKGNTVRSYSFYTQTGGTLHFSVTSGGAYLGSNSADTVPLNEWAHAAAMVKAGTQKYFINGEPAGDGQSGITLPGTQDQDPVRIGNSMEGDREFLGMIDDVRIYNIGLTQEQVRQAMRGDPLLAWDPHPADGAIADIRDAESLLWQAGDAADKHDVYFGTDADAVADAGTGSPEYKGRQADTSYPLAGLVEFGGGPYFWRIDEVEAGGTNVHAGRLWTFRIADYFIIDDFEAYTNDSPNRVFQTWIDGWGFSADESFPDGNPGNGTGATVGHDIWTESSPDYGKTIVDTAIVRPDGKQSMPLGYDNSNKPYNSEAERTWASPQNWTLNDVNTLSLEVYGYPVMTTTAVSETGGKMTLTGAGTDIWGNSDEFTFAYKTLNGDGSLIAKVTSNGTGSNTWAKGGVMIRDSLTGASTHAMMIMTGGAGNGASFQNRPVAGLASAASDSATVRALPYWVKIDRAGDTLTGYVSSDGTAWTVQDLVNIKMTDPAYIGICVTSGAPGEDRTFQFEGIKSTGGISGQWQGAVIDRPVYNSPQDFYVVLQDSQGKSAVVTNAAAVNSGDWLDVQIPLSQFTGVNMSKIKKMIIGVGSHTSPTADGSGLLFIDDIRVLKPQVQTQVGP